MKQLQRYAQAALGAIFRHPLTGTSIIPVLSDGRIVLVQRRDNGKWSLPGWLEFIQIPIAIPGFTASVL